MERRGGLTLVDELTGESVAVEPGKTAAELIEWRLAEVDHPRADFRGQPLEFHLLDTDGEPIPADRAFTEAATVRLTSSDAVDVLARRNRWLADIESSGGSTTSVSSGTQLALVERTESRLDDVARLRAELAANRPPPPRPRSRVRVRVGAALLTVAVLLIIAAIFAAWIWWFVDELDTSSASGVEGDRPVPVTVAAEPLAEAAFEEEAFDEVPPPAAVPIPIGPGGLPNQGCEILEAGLIELPGEVAVELSCEVLVVVLNIVEAGTLEVNARSGASGDPIVWLFDEAGVEVGFNDDAAGLDSLLIVEVEPGRHELHVQNLTVEPAAIEVAIEVG
jgi:hypothetical protein